MLIGGKLALPSKLIARAAARHPASVSFRAMASKLSQGELAAAATLPLPEGCTGLVDIGANLADKAFAEDLPDVLSRAADAGVTAAVVTGCSLQSSRAAQALCQQPLSPVELVFTAGVRALLRLW